MSGFSQEHRPHAALLTSDDHNNASSVFAVGIGDTTGRGPAKELFDVPVPVEMRLFSADGALHATGIDGHTQSSAAYCAYVSVFSEFLRGFLFAGTSQK